MLWNGSIKNVRDISGRRYGAGHLHVYLVCDANAQTSGLAKYLERYNMNGYEINRRENLTLAGLVKCETCYFNANLALTLLEHKGANTAEGSYLQTE